MFDMTNILKNQAFRSIKNAQICGKFIKIKGKRLLNLGSNDYLGIASDAALQREFLLEYLSKFENNLKSDFNDNFIPLGAGSSRLIYSDPAFSAVESWFEREFAPKKAVFFNSGFGANSGVISAIFRHFKGKILFLADRLIHASIIDGLKGSNFRRFAHNDRLSLLKLIEENHAKFDKIIIISEALFSMDGDACDLEFLAALKKTNPKIMLFIDEAHSFFAQHKLGLCQKSGVLWAIDFILITLGKAVGSAGAVILSEFKDEIINFTRTLIFSTALPPLSAAWTSFVLNKDFSKRRENLSNLIEFLGLGESQICPFIVGENEACLKLSNKLKDAGFFIPAIRAPSVPSGSARLRISLRGDLETADLSNLKEILNEN